MFGIFSLVDHTETSARRDWARFVAILGGLFLLRLVIDQVAIQNQALALIGQIVVTAVFLIAPICAIYFAARHLTAKSAGVIFAIGIVLHLGGMLASNAMGKEPSFGRVILESLAMAGLSLWTTGLGGLVAAMIRDKNLIPPIAIFLAGFDMFLIFNPTSVTQVIMKSQPQLFQSAAYQIPTFGIGPAAYVGPADFFIIGLLFVTISRFNMRSAQTLKWVCGTLLIYLFIVIFAGDAAIGPVSLGQLPALVPIGLTAMFVNWREFTMSKEERWMTVFVAFVALSLAGYGIYKASQPKPVLPAETTTTTK